jgi:ribosomal protein S18 acetylase RimI-like enzyme
MQDVTIRPSGRSDAEVLLRLMDIASHGFIRHLFASVTPVGQTTDDFIRSRMDTRESGISFGKMWVADLDGQVAGFIALDRVPEDPGPIGDDGPAMFRPLTELEHEAPGTGLVNLVASLTEYRGRGVGTALMRFAEGHRGPNGMCLTVLDDNTQARRIYERLGYTVRASRPIVRNGWNPSASDWLLMVKP